MNRMELLHSKVVVLAGGWSDEKEISLSSGRACQAALIEAGFKKVDLIDIAEESFLQRLTQEGYDVAYVALHGRYGEDGCIQGLLEILHIPYTFSGVLASAIGTEKEIAKTLYKRAAIPVPSGIDIPGDTILTYEQAESIADTFGLPLFVKPAANGSSYGITRVKEICDLSSAVQVAGAEGDRVLIEECVTGTEITVPVVGNTEPCALPIVEILTGAEFYDLKVKYEPSALHHVIPARLDPKTYSLAQELAVRAHLTLGCRGASRSDFIVRNDGTPVILETNTIPGMTETSLLPDAARYAGIEFPELCTRFIEYAFEAYVDRVRL